VGTLHGSLHKAVYHEQCTRTKNPPGGARKEGQRSVLTSYDLGKRGIAEGTTPATQRASEKNRGGDMEGPWEGGKRGGQEMNEG